MDLFSRSISSNYGGVPTDPVLWERHILNQQGAAYCRRTRSVRKFTVEGIPTFEAFQKEWEERHSCGMPAEGDSPVSVGFSVHEEDASHSSSPEPCMFEMSDLGEGPPSSKKAPVQPPSSGSSWPRHAHGSFRGCSPFISPRYSPYSSPKRTRKYASKDRCHQPPSSESFEETARRDRAKFHAQQQNPQHHGKHGRHRPSALPKREQFANAPQPRQTHHKMPDVRFTTNLYYQWREECDVQFQDKTAMSSIPTPPIPACVRCQQDAIIGRSAIPMTCIHSLETLFRGATKGPGNDPHDRNVYYRTLKEERNRWHTDRFGKCNAAFKPEIDKMSHLLFVQINELFVKEKGRLDGLRAAKEAAKAVHTPNNDKTMERKVW